MIPKKCKHLIIPEGLSDVIICMHPETKGIVKKTYCDKECVKNPPEESKNE
jgi:hypothetical protein